MIRSDASARISGGIDVSVKEVPRSSWRDLLLTLIPALAMRTIIPLYQERDVKSIDVYVARKIIAAKKLPTNAIYFELYQ